MIIESISLQHFQCFYGNYEENTFNFSKGVNLIIGNNGHGKSKLYDAFYWVLYDHVFVSDTREFTPTHLYKDALISDKAKSFVENGERITAGVILVAQDSHGKRFRITREYSAECRSDSLWNSSSNSDLRIEEEKGVSWVLRGSLDYDAILGRVLPGHLKPYMWFQGEQVDSLMDLTSKSTLTKAIKLFSNIGVYEGIIESLQKMSSKAENEYNKKSRDKSKDFNASKKLEEKIEELDRSITTYIDRYNEALTNKKEAEIGRDEMIAGIDDAKRRAELKVKYEIRLEELKNKENELNEKYRYLPNQLFAKTWVLRNTESTLKKFIDKYSVYDEKHTLIRIQRSKDENPLPVNVPQRNHVEQMLNKEKCFVCGSSAIKGSKEYEHLESLLMREDDVVKSIFRQDCSSFFRGLYENAFTSVNLSGRVDNEIASYLNSIELLRSEVGRIGREIKEIEKEFGTLIEDDSSDSTVKEFDRHNKNVEQFSNQASSLDAKVKGFKKEKEKAQESLAGLVVGEIDAKFELTKDIFSVLLEAAGEAKNFVFADLVAKLEDSANEIYRSMSERNTAITGLVKLKKLEEDRYVPEIVDEDGRIIRSSNDSNIILIKLALIMAVVNAKPLWSKNYTLISDAPTAKMAENYTSGFYKALSDNFTQSIVLTYDFYDEADREGLRALNIGRVYTVEAEVAGANKQNRSALSVNIQEVMI